VGCGEHDDPAVGAEWRDSYLDSMMVAYTILRNEVAAGLIESSPTAANAG
jgi:hypothetical protein